MRERINVFSSSVNFDPGSARRGRNVGDAERQSGECGGEMTRKIHFRCDPDDIK